MDKDVKDCNKVALRAIEKELNVEDLIRKEETLREKREEEAMLKRIQTEEVKSVKKLINLKDIILYKIIFKIF